MLINLLQEATLCSRMCWVSSVKVVSSSMTIMIFNLGYIINFRILAKWQPYWYKGAHDDDGEDSDYDYKNSVVVVVVVLVLTTKHIPFFLTTTTMTGRIYTEINKTLLLAHTHQSELREWKTTWFMRFTITDECTADTGVFFPVCLCVRSLHWGICLRCITGITLCVFSFL